MLKGFGFVLLTVGLLYLAGVTPSSVMQAIDRAGESSKVDGLDQSDTDWG